MRTQTLNGVWQFRQVGQTDWQPAQVPGGVHTDLLALGLIPDPFVGDNSGRLGWIADLDWEYRRLFTVDAALQNAERVFLVCDGLDTLAEVCLNGQALGTTDNMYRAYRWDVAALLRPGENELQITFRSATKCAAQRQAAHNLTHLIGPDTYVRKAPYHFGWDWGPTNLPPVGVWQAVRLEGGATARLDDVHVRQQHAAGQVTLNVQVTVETWRPAPLTARVQVTAPDGGTLTAHTELTNNQGALTLPIPQPQLWWPAGYGPQPLYQVTVALLAGETVCDQRVCAVGLRTVRWRQDPDEWGRSFTLEVNGVPVFAKGSNLVPPDSFPTRVTLERWEQLLAAALAANHNMLRVWGGGYYLPDEVYDWCDRHGLMIWQDLMFACHQYVWEEAWFVDTVRAEVTQQARRLRSHACLVLWCGDNEIEMIVGQKKTAPEYAAECAAYKAFAYRQLPAWLTAVDPDTPYWPSSPSSHLPLTEANGEESGDKHNWEVWWMNKSFAAYRNCYARFVSEFGFQGLPALETVRAFAPDPAEWNLGSRIMDHHQRCPPDGYSKIVEQVARWFRQPKDFAGWIYVSQVLQAEAIRYGVEHWRRHKARVSGALYWQLNDCWPVVSWAGLDYFGRWKALHYAARRFYAPVLLSLLEQGRRVSLHVTSDVLQDWRGQLRWAVLTLAGEVLQAGQHEVALAALVSQEIAAVEVPAGREFDTVVVGELCQDGTRLALAVTPVVPSKFLDLQPPRIQVDIQLQAGRAVCTLRAQSLARFVELALVGAEVIFSDNYFDLPSGYAVEMTCPAPAGWTAEQIRAALQVRSLRDSYN